ncbi:phosphoribosylglycinamide formyltransferase [Moraxella macacae 0408225]|uniref:Phosphoribosylglycinamide formyltransferase n=1 Tax=Moraxella macacae 0408225 TaxID=1230338 RepID=L2F7T5_9GAMM|nr:phosphoribosylglycinamide formyltransferase [Moraxella macacae]ELA08846.1 phosphoribosylglycinamide formyltransferase [Moraxella macacae 0408225]
MNKNPLKIAVLVSGNGSNLQVLIDKQLNKTLNIDIVGVISNKPCAYALTRAKTANIPTVIIDKDSNGKKHTRVGFETHALQILKQWQPDLVILAGFMKILTPLFIHGVTIDLNIAMINLHPSLLPMYKGLDTHRRILKSGENHHGCSVHLVTTELDSGQVIAQAVTPVMHSENRDALQQRIHKLEHQLLPMVVNLFAERILMFNQQQLTNKIGINLPLKLFFD